MFFLFCFWDLANYLGLVNQFCNNVCLAYRRESELLAKQPALVNNVCKCVFRNFVPLQNVVMDKSSCLSHMVFNLVSLDTNPSIAVDPNPGLVALADLALCSARMYPETPRFTVSAAAMAKPLPVNQDTTLHDVTEIIEKVGAMPWICLTCLHF